MSDNWLIIVPVDPFAAPGAGAVEAARAAVERGLPDADEVTVERSGRPALVSAGANLQRVSCPACGADLGDWWADQVEHAGDDLAVTTPCCGATTSLNDLVYDWPQAFARVSIEAMNPNVTELAPALKTEVERHLGTPTRIVWQHI